MVSVKPAALLQIWQQRTMPGPGQHPRLKWLVWPPLTSLQPLTRWITISSVRNWGDLGVNDPRTVCFGHYLEGHHQCVSYTSTLSSPSPLTSGVQACPGRPLGPVHFLAHIYNLPSAMDIDRLPSPAQSAAQMTWSCASLVPRWRQYGQWWRWKRVQWLHTWLPTVWHWIQKKSRYSGLDKGHLLPTLTLETPLCSNWTLLRSSGWSLTTSWSLTPTWLHSLQQSHRIQGLLDGLRHTSLPTWWLMWWGHSLLVKSATALLWPSFPVLEMRTPVQPWRGMQHYTMSCEMGNVSCHLSLKLYEWPKGTRNVSRDEWNITVAATSGMMSLSYQLLFKNFAKPSLMDVVCDGIVCKTAWSSACHLLRDHC